MNVFSQPIRVSVTARAIVTDDQTHVCRETTRKVETKGLGDAWRAVNAGVRSDGRRVALIGCERGFSHEQQSIKSKKGWQHMTAATKTIFFLRRFAVGK